MNTFELAVIIFTLIGVVLAYWAPGLAVGIVVLAVGALAFFGPRADD